MPRVPDPKGPNMQTKHPRILFDADEAGGDGGADPAEGEPKLAGAALQSALKKERSRNDDLEKELKAVKKRLDDADTAAERAKREAENASKSEVEQLRERLERVESERDQERTARESADADRKRVDLIRAHAADFADADDVVALLRGRGELDSIDDADEAQRVLADLKRDKPHLLKQDPAPTGLEQILRNGEPQKGQPDGEGNQPSEYIAGDKLLKMDDAALAALKRTNPELYYRSVDKLGQSETVHTTVR